MGKAIEPFRKEVVLATKFHIGELSKPDETSLYRAIFVPKVKTKQMKRIFFVYPLAIATLFLIVLSAIPHHHHKEMMCTVTVSYTHLALLTAGKFRRRVRPFSGRGIFHSLSYNA